MLMDGIWLSARTSVDTSPRSVQAIDRTMSENSFCTPACLRS
jgi:hypothetical protein